jgi:hypothetical protein
MMAKSQNGEQVRPLVQGTNADIINLIRDEASPEFQRRIPAATKATMHDTLQTLMRYESVRNEFYDALVNEIGNRSINKLRWLNPLAEFKRAAMQYGSTQEEIAVGMVNAHVYDPNNEYLGDDIYGTYKAPIKSVFHTVNRENWYPITINESQVRKAFENADSGLSMLNAEIMQSPVTSDNNDEFLSMCNLFPEYANMGGYWKVHVPSVSLDSDAQAAARQLLKNVRAMIYKLPIKPWTEYNAAHMPSVVSRDDLILFTTPEVHAAMDVDALAAAFGVDYMAANARIFDIPSEMFGLEKAQAVLTTKQFFYVWDYQYLTTTSGMNPISQNTNYFLHHKEAISLSPFAPAVLFWEGDGSLEIIKALGDITIDTPTLQIALQKYGNPAVQPTDVKRGGVVQVVANATSANFSNLNNVGVSYKIVENDASTAGAKLPADTQFTTIANTGVLRVGLGETASTITVEATVSYIDPATPEVVKKIAKRLAVPVSGDGLLGLQSGFVTNLTVAAPATLDVGEVGHVVATATLTDGRTADVSALVTWSVDKPAVATVAVDGSMTGLTAGDVVASATLFAVTAKASKTTVA